jgi:5S rRNA maturation endonuclease (ribonuclease M5)
MDTEKDTKTVTFKMNTDNPRRVVLEILCDFDLDGSDLEDALKELLRVIQASSKNAHKQKAGGH